MLDPLPTSTARPSGSSPPPFQPIAVSILIDERGVVTLALLNQAHGLVLPAVDPNSLVAPTYASVACAEVGGSSQLGGLAVPEDFPFDHHDDGTAEPRDLVLVTNSAGCLLVYDVQERGASTLVGQIELPGPARSIAIDRTWPSPAACSRTQRSRHSVAEGCSRNRPRGRAPHVSLLASCRSTTTLRPPEA